MRKIIIKNAKEMNDFAVRLNRSLKGGDVLAVSGDLGTGKTTLAQSLSALLGINDKVNSPTFNIIKVYKTNKKGKVNKFIHIDTYRLKSSAELLAIGIEDYFKQKDVVIFIEWPEKIIDILPKKVKNIKIEYLDRNKRVIYY